MEQKNKTIPRRERKATQMIWCLFRADLDWIGKLIMSLIHRAWWNKPVTPQRAPKPHPDHPQEPYQTTRAKQRGDLLIFVPRSLESLLIDHLTGTYGYSHLAVDCGEVDATGKPVMIESTTGEVVQRKYQDEYGARHFVRIPLSQTGVDPEAFCACVESKLGQPYDDLEALTWGDIDDPAKQVCSDLAAVCLPDAVREEIARQARERKLRRRSVSVHSRPSDHNLREFISPNGFAQYFGAPPGKAVHQPDQPVMPRIMGQGEAQPILRRAGVSWPVVLIIAGVCGGAAMGIAWLMRHRAAPEITLSA